MNNNQHLLECSAQTPLWELVLLAVLSVAFIGLIIYMGKDLADVNNKIKNFKNK